MDARGVHRMISCQKATRYAEFARYPKIKAAYVRAFDRMLDERRRRGKWTEVCALEKPARM